MQPSQVLPGMPVILRHRCTYFPRQIYHFKKKKKNKQEACEQIKLISFFLDGNHFRDRSPGMCEGMSACQSVCRCTLISAVYMLVYVYEYVCVDICMCLCTRIYENICGERVYNFFLSPSLCASLNVSVYPAHTLSLSTKPRIFLTPTSQAHFHPINHVGTVAVKQER